MSDSFHKHMIRKLVGAALMLLVAMIALQILIWAPGFIEFPVRAKVARANGDMRSVATAIESYRVDFDAYPAVDPATLPKPDDYRFSAEFSRRSLALLTTPVAYISASDLLDPFADPNSPEPWFRYANLRDSKHIDLLRAMKETGGDPIGVPLPLPLSGGSKTGNAAFKRLKAKGYLLMSVGPDGTSYLRSPAGEPDNAGVARAYSYLAMPERGEGWDFLYDPTNGTESGGDIVRSAMGVRN